MPVYVDYHGETFKQIYGTFNMVMLKIIPTLRYSVVLCSIMLRMIPTLSDFAEPLTNAMVEFYRFTQDKQPHYVLSPREMTRCVMTYLW